MGLFDNVKFNIGYDRGSEDLYRAVMKDSNEDPVVIQKLEKRKRGFFMNLTSKIANINIDLRK